MEAALGLQSNGGNESKSKAEAVEPAESELELGLSLSLCGGGGGGVLKSNQNQPCGWGDYGRILTAKDFPSLLSHGGSSSSSSDNNNNNNASVVAVSGSKRSANYSVAHEIGSATANSQAVGWPPIGAYRMNSLVSQAKVPSNEEKAIGENDKPKDSSKKKVYNGSNKNDSSIKEKGHLGFVKVNTDGLPIGRKVDLNAHSCYETLAQALEEMFFRSTPTLNRIRLGGERDQAARPSKLLDTSSEFLLTYEDKEGDWMLVGDVPWRMFLSTVKRLRIMRTSEANGLALRFQERRNLPGNKPI